MALSRIRPPTEASWRWETHHGTLTKRPHAVLTGYCHSLRMSWTIADRVPTRCLGRSLTAFQPGGRCGCPVTPSRPGQRCASGDKDLSLNFRCGLATREPLLGWAATCADGRWHIVAVSAS